MGSIPPREITGRSTINRLQGKALAIVMVYRDDKSKKLNIDDVRTFLTPLKTSVGDRNRTSSAPRELHQFGQGKEDFATYYAKFTHNYGKGLWNEVAKQDALKQRMSEDLEQAMMTVLDNITSDLKYLIDFQLLDNGIRSHN